MYNTQLSNHAGRKTRELQPAGPEPPRKLPAPSHHRTTPVLKHETRILSKPQTTHNGCRNIGSKSKMKSILPRAQALSRATHELSRATIIPVATTSSTSRRPFSILNRPPPNYPGHVPLTRIERAGLAIGSGIISLVNPYRGGMYHISYSIFLPSCPSAPPPHPS